MYHLRPPRGVGKTDEQRPRSPEASEGTPIDADPDADAVAAFRASADAMGVHDADVDDLIGAARTSASSGQISLAEALHQESSELSVHLGREG